MFYKIASPHDENKWRQSGFCQELIRQKCGEGLWVFLQIKNTRQPFTFSNKADQRQQSWSSVLNSERF